MALLIFAILALAFIGWRLHKTNMAVPWEAEKIIPANKPWNYFSPEQIIYNVNPRKGIDLPKT